MKVYKFRSLGDNQSLERAEEIIRSSEFWCSRFWEMNDPMEGYYKRNTSLDDEAISELFFFKSATLICCFSKGLALTNPLMWGYYGGGFKGVAIEVEVPEESLLPIVYSNDFRSITSSASLEMNVKTILSRKLKCWKHEREVRFLCHDDNGMTKKRHIGKISGVVIGRSFQRTFKNPDVYGRWDQVNVYQDSVNRIVAIAEEQGLNLKTASMKSGRVLIREMPK